MRMKLAALASAAVCTTLAPAAQAGEVACWYEEGVIVAPASIAGLAGDYIIDTAAPSTLLHETKGQMAGYLTPTQHGDVEIAGLDLADRPFTVADLDARTAAFPTPIAGVIGADILGAYVVDISFAPCRIAIRPAAEAPGFQPAIALPFQVGRNLPTARATVSDGTRVFGGDFLLSTGADAPVRLDTRLASVPGEGEADKVLPNGGVLARLKALSFEGQLSTRVPAGLIRGEDPNLAGVLGAPFLAHWRLRFDYPGRQILLTR